MQALGNDFIMIDAVSRPSIPVDEKHPYLIAALADRHRGIGCDQLLIARESRSENADIYCQIFNADGSEAEQCGNGLRCFARFVHANKRVSQSRGMAIETCGGIFQADILVDNTVRVDMGVPVFDPEKIPLLADTQQKAYTLCKKDGSGISMGSVSMGNPHAVMQVDDVQQADVLGTGAELESHAVFPKRSNIEFMQVLDRHSIQLRIYERGAGETHACGSGACAAVAVGQLWEVLADDVKVVMNGGTLQVTRDPSSGHLWMAGEANFVFDGTIDLDTL